MALEIGAGITFGSGISLTVTSGGGGGGGGGTTYTRDVDYGSDPAGVSFLPPGGAKTQTYIKINPTFWTNSAGFNAMLAVPNGGSFTISAVPDAGGSPTTITITLNSAWATLFGSVKWAYISASIPVSTAGSDSVPLSVTLGA